MKNVYIIARYRVSEHHWIIFHKHSLGGSTDIPCCHSAIITDMAMRQTVNVDIMYMMVQKVIRHHLVISK